MNFNYNIPDGFSVDTMISALMSYLENSKGLFAQCFNGQNQWVVQAREPKAWKKLLAMDSAITIRLTLNGNALSASIGEEKWIDKAVGLGLGIWLFPVLLVPTAVGAFQQYQLPDDINKFICDYIASNGAYSSAQFVVEKGFTNSSDLCPNCGATVSSDAKFCSKCGTKIEGGI